jgi:hypothetical protein
MILTGGLGIGGGLAARGYGAWSGGDTPAATQGIGRASGAGRERLPQILGVRPADVEASRRMATSHGRPEPIAQERLPVVAAIRHTVTASARPAVRMASRRNTQGRTR